MLISVYSSQQAQQCFRYARSSALDDTNTFYSWACGTASDDILVLATSTVEGEVLTAGSGTTGIDDFLRSITSGVQPTAGSKSPTAGVSGGSGGSSSNSISTTAIALITVAGIAVLVIALLIGYFCWWRKRYQDNNDVVKPKKQSQLQYEPTVTQGPRTEVIPAYGGSRDEIMASWSGRTPLGANPNVPPSEAASEWSGPTASEMPQRMSTVHESGSSFGNRFYDH